MTIKDILKRKPDKASGEFWGGKKTAWEKGQKVEVETEGWFEEMCLNRIREMADDLGDEIAERMSKIFANMPLIQEA